MNPARTVHFVVPDGIDDPTRPSGGNVYDRRLHDGLAAGGWSVQTTALAGAWPWADEAARESLGAALEAPPAGSVVLVDGLVASTVPELLLPASRRLRLVILMHMPLGRRGRHEESFERERAVLSAAAAVVTTSDWSRTWLLDAYALEPAKVVVATPGVDPARPAVGTVSGGNLLCVASVTPDKGHDILLAALARVVDLEWRCVCVGALTRAPDFVMLLSSRAQATGVGDRLVLAGPRSRQALEASYAAADALVLASRSESYGMVVTEALACGLPVLATDVGGVSEALGRTPEGTRPGLLTPAADVDAFAGSLRRWLSEPDLRRTLRAAARTRRAELVGWSATTARVVRILDDVAA